MTFMFIMGSVLFMFVVHCSYPDKFELCQRKPSTGFDKILLQVQENGLRCNNLSTLTFQHSYDSSLAVMITMVTIPTTVSLFSNFYVAEYWL